VNTLYDLLFSEVLWHSTYTGCCKVVIPCLHAPQAAELLITWFLPFSNQIFISMTLFQAKLVQFLGDLFSTIVEIINIAALLMWDAKDGPQCLALALPVMRIIFSCILSAICYIYIYAYHNYRHYLRDKVKETIPSLILASSSRKVGSISSHPSGYFTRLVFIFGILLHQTH
jgi:hypothetical protein